MLSLNPGSLSEVGPSSGPGSSSFVWKYCRMCALEVKQGVYIFGEEGKRLQIPEKIRKTVAILVLEEDSLPKKICTGCCTSLEAYTQFKDSVVDAQEKLSSIAKSIEKSHEASLIQLRNKQALKSPKRQKIYHSSLPAHSGCHLMFPTPSVISAPEPDLAEPAIECDEPPSSVVSLSSDEDEIVTTKSTPECSPSNDNGSKNDDNLHVSLQGHSPTLAMNKQPVREGVSSHSVNESDENQFKSVTNKSPVYSADSGCGGESSQTDANLSCGLCGAICRDKDSVFSHHNKCHDSKNDVTFGCSSCPRTSSNYEHIRQHIHRHRVAGLFKCPDCDNGFSTKDQLHLHITSKHNLSITKSSVSQQQGIKQHSINVTLTPHERKKHPGCTTTAGITGETAQQTGESSSPSSTRVFIQSSENSSSITGESTSSDGRIFSQSESVPAASKFLNSPGKNSDKVEVAQALIKVDLNINSRAGASCDSLEQTQKESSNVSISEDKDGYWKCDYCDKILRSKNGYDTHMAAHKGRRFSCNHCGVSYTQKSSLEHHVKVHHTNIDKEFECPECNKRFKTFRQLGWHKKTHEKPLTDVRCPQCEKTFKNMVSFKTHMKLHRGSKKFACTDCPKAFYTKAKLQEHMNSHTGRRPFGCPIDNCSKVFSCFSNYSKHFKKHHHAMLGPKGSMIPPPKTVESNNNLVALKQTEAVVHSKRTSPTKGSQGVLTVTAVVKEPHSANSNTSKSQEVSSRSTQAQEAHSHGTVSVHQSYQIGLLETSSHNQTSLRPLPVIYSGSSSSSLPVQTSTTSSQTFGSQSCSISMPMAPSNTPGHSHSSPLPLHVPSSVSSTENPSLAHAQSVAVGSLQSHGHVHHSGNIHSHGSSIHNTHSSHPPTSSSNQSHHQNQFQPQNHIQSVWQPMVLPNSKSYHNPNSSTSLTTINGLDLLDCAGSVHPSDTLTSSNNSHSHSQHHQSGISALAPSNNAAHHATSHASVVHAHHNITLPGHSSNPHIGSSHHSSSSSSIPHSTSNSSGHGVPNSTTASTVNMSSFGSLTQQSEPMELSYKDSNNFQDMPMELTKVFQRDPLELCVRQDFGHAQPLMDLSSRVVNVSVGGNPSINASTMAMNLNGSSGNTSSSSNTQSHYTSISNGNASTSSSILTIPYHKTVEIVERELSLNDFTGAFRQPIDLISRSDDQSHELCSEGSLVDLSLRSSFGQDQSASSFLRELIDLSSRSDSFHGEVNLTNKQNPPASAAHSQIHHHSHSSGHHSVAKSSSAALSGHHHHHHSNHHSHHHHSNQSHQSGSTSSNSVGGASLQPVMYPESNAIFNLQN